MPSLASRRLAWMLSVALCLMAAGPATAGDSPRDWLGRMAHALEYLNYEGTLIQLEGQEPAVMRIVHRVEQGVPTERITALDGVGREIIRKGEIVTCILPDQRVVLVENRDGDGRNASPLQRQFGGDVDLDDRYYRLTIATGGKLLGRDTHVVSVSPTDSYRYGYRLWLDHATALPLKIQVTAEDDTVVEQLLFSDISLPAHIAESAVQPTMATESYTRHRSTTTTTRSKRAEPAEAGWTISHLPPGFELRAVRTQRRLAPAQAGVPEATEAMQQLVYSDGVTSVSVFVEAGVAVAERAEGTSKIGAANAYTTMAADYLVTAMGEVPARTVEAMARSARPSAPEPDPVSASAPLAP